MPDANAKTKRIGLLNRIWHVAQLHRPSGAARRGPALHPDIRRLIKWEREAGLDSGLVWIDTTLPQESEYTTASVPAPTLEKKLDGDALLDNILLASTLKALPPETPIWVLRVSRDIFSSGEPMSPAEQESFSRTFWQLLIDSLSIGRRDVLALHSMAFKGMLQTRDPNEEAGPGVVITPETPSTASLLSFPSLLPIPSSPVPQLEGNGPNAGILHLGFPVAAAEIDSTLLVYLQSVYGTGYEAPLHITQAAVREERRVFDGIYTMAREKEGPPHIMQGLLRARLAGNPVLSAVMDPADVHLIGLSNTPSTEKDDPAEEIIPNDGRIDANGPAYYELFERILAVPDGENKCFLVSSRAGGTNRLPFAEDTKADTLVGEGCMDEAAFAAAISLAEQLPYRGKGMIIGLGTDNLDGHAGFLKVGPLIIARSDSLQMMMMQPHRVDPEDLGVLEKFRQRGTATANQNGKALQIGEKKPPSVLAAMLRAAGTNIINENTMLQVLTYEGMQLAYLAWSLPTTSGQKFIRRYPIVDLVGDYFEPQTYSTTTEKEEWMARFEARCKAAGIECDRNDLRGYLDFILGVTEETGGVDVVPISLFRDMGDVLEYNGIHSEMLDPDPKVRALRRFLRYVCGLRLDTSFPESMSAQLHFVGADGKILPAKINICGDPAKIYVGDGVSLALGTVIEPYTMLTHGTALRVPLHLPERIVVAGGKIGLPVLFPSAADPAYAYPWRLIYRADINPDTLEEPVRLPSGGCLIGFDWVLKHPRKGLLPCHAVVPLPSIALKRPAPVVDETGAIRRDPVFGLYPLVANMASDPSCVLPGPNCTWEFFVSKRVPGRPAR